MFLVCRLVLRVLLHCVPNHRIFVHQVPPSNRPMFADLKYDVHKKHMDYELKVPDLLHAHRTNRLVGLVQNNQVVLILYHHVRG